MTLFIPDTSHHQGAINVQGLINDGAAALLARAGQGAGLRGNGQTYGTTRDTQWQRTLAEAKRLGLLIAPYWYIGNKLTPDDNARLAAEWVGDTSLPWMLDCEDASGDIAFYRKVVDAFGRRGLRVILSYIPSWYWSGVGRRASLAGLPPLVSSRYATTSGPPAVIYPGDNGVGWQPYGDNTVALWQFTNRAQMAGQLVDCSAFRGTRAQLAALFGGAKPQENDMTAYDTNVLERISNRLGALLKLEPHVTADLTPTGTGGGVDDKLDEDLPLVARFLALEKDVADLKARPAADVDEAALAAELETRGISGVSAAEVKQIVLGAFARAGQPEGGTV